MVVEEFFEAPDAPEADEPRPVVISTIKKEDIQSEWIIYPFNKPTKQPLDSSFNQSNQFNNPTNHQSVEIEMEENAQSSIEQHFAHLPKVMVCACVRAAWRVPSLLANPAFHPFLNPSVSLNSTRAET